MRLYVLLLFGLGEYVSGPGFCLTKLCYGQLKHGYFTCGNYSTAWTHSFEMLLVYNFTSQIASLDVHYHCLGLHEHKKFNFSVCVHMLGWNLDVNGDCTLSDLPAYIFFHSSRRMQNRSFKCLNVRVYVDRKCIKCFLLVVIWSYCSGWSCKNHSTMGEVAFK